MPYLADLFTLRRVPVQAFGLFMSVNLVLAAVVGWIGLGQNLGWMEWMSIGAIVVANALSILSRRRPTFGPARPSDAVGEPCLVSRSATSTDHCAGPATAGLHDDVGAASERYLAE